MNRRESDLSSLAWFFRDKKQHEPIEPNPNRRLEDVCALEWFFRNKQGKHNESQ